MSWVEENRKNLPRPLERFTNPEADAEVIIAAISAYGRLEDFRDIGEFL